MKVNSETADTALTLLEFLAEPEEGWSEAEQDCVDTLRRYIEERR